MAEVSPPTLVICKLLSGSDTKCSFCGHLQNSSGMAKKRYDVMSIKNWDT